MKAQVGLTETPMNAKVQQNKFWLSGHMVVPSNPLLACLPMQKSLLAICRRQWTARLTSVVVEYVTAMLMRNRSAAAEGYA